MTFQTGMSLLDQASWSGLEDVVQFLLANGVDPNTSAHDCGYKSLMFAAIAGHQGFFFCVQFLQFMRNHSHRKLFQFDCIVGFDL